ncbi:MAG: 16S rRNA (cytidine(1402)-2'-O)-methyltransferase [Streptosporangiales bacterium]|nr:16S rRNA (cytidine(1402)-2'-O)-methyltransferase [Streptosporangiales bacterium]
MTNAESGRLVLAGMPIGRPEDASPRLREALAGAELIAAEDTRRLRLWASRAGVRLAGRVVSYHDANERRRAEELLAELQAGTDVLVVTDAGMPGVSDPGYRLVTEAVRAGVPVTALPGPSAVTTALVLSGLPSDRFCFEGFLPRKAGERRSRLAELRDERRTMVFFESPHRLAAALGALGEAFGPERRAAVCRELTKTHEEVVRAPLAELAAWAAGDVRGEITLVVAGAEAVPPPSAPGDLAAEVARRESAGTPRKQAIAEAARDLGVPKRHVYDAVHRP